METFSALLAICVGNSLVTGEFPAQGPVTRSFYVFLDLHLNKQLVNNREAGDLRRHSAHYDIIVMIIKDERVVFSNAYMEPQTKIKYYWKGILASMWYLFCFCIFIPVSNYSIFTYSK